MSKSENYVAKLMESVGVIKVAFGVKRAELMGLRQAIMTNLSEHL